MSNDPAINATVTDRLKSVTSELRTVEEMLVSEHLDSTVLTDFRDAVNRVRTTAWAVQQSLDCHGIGEQSAAVLSSLANERVRVTYRLCRVMDADLANGRLDHSQLVQLYLAVQDLAHQLGEKLGREGVGRPPQTVGLGG